MGLIQTRNFVAPFKNRLHIGAIVIAAFLFGVFRLSGGSLELSSKKASYRGSETQQGAVSRTEEFARPERTAPDLIGEAARLRPPPPQKKEATRDSGLDDIERALGLRGGK